jgi:hypothetical protein
MLESQNEKVIRDMGWLFIGELSKLDYEIK